MEPAEIIIHVYQQAKLSITDKLGYRGYQPVHEEHHDPVFNSCYMIWSNNHEALRLTWDGKECWFILEITETLPLKALTPWEEILVRPFNAHNTSPQYFKEVIQDIIDSLE